ncbi:hypothetical protein A2344_04685 [Candidatus Peregrinibacteria bacterium RIFOXYB12_FULL_41_12]|nr:MAG: hypothetical protein A2344_04685 [Candidatus Peregrinibacteria bacterium RIFOXYB12_FULL_41_12]OGJ48659.1 MAG: hypothetical protein A2244_03110 [Candidatus Peregrinibacteria bacterium RIFOXYA2_FULL_41_18]OGJ55304.1 MAG: hypothetical protein A2336_01135 [Candidatus Peregrinibacteria bacterium RIFOXYB2_FULL_41_88]
MAKITKQQVSKVAHLARIKLTDEELEKFTSQIEGVLEYMDVLNEVDTAGVAPTSQVTGLSNVMREDEIVDFVAKDELLKCTPLEVERRQVKVKKVL